jgi:hypothetical protein
VQIAADVTARLRWDIWISGDLIASAVRNGKVTLTGYRWQRNRQITRVR